MQQFHVLRRALISRAEEDTQSHQSLLALKYLLFGRICTEASADYQFELVRHEAAPFTSEQTRLMSNLMRFQVAHLQSSGSSSVACTFTYLGTNKRVMQIHADSLRTCSVLSEERELPFGTPDSWARSV